MRCRELVRGQQVLAQQRYGEAKEALGRALACEHAHHDPGEAPGFLLGLTCLWLEEVKEAEEAFRRDVDARGYAPSFLLLQWCQMLSYESCVAYGEAVRVATQSAEVKQAIDALEGEFVEVIDEDLSASDVEYALWRAICQWLRGDAAGCFNDLLCIAAPPSWMHQWISAFWMAMAVEEEPHAARLMQEARQAGMPPVLGGLLQWKPSTQRENA